MVTSSLLLIWRGTNPLEDTSNYKQQPTTQGQGFGLLQNSHAPTHLSFCKMFLTEIEWKTNAKLGITYIVSS